jgi:hypothetical protein
MLVANCVMSEVNQTINAKHEGLIRRLLGQRKKTEALTWLKGGSRDEERIVGGGKTNRASIRLIKEIYGAGAVEIYAVQIRKQRGQNRHRTGKLVVKLPPDKKLRQTIFNWCRQQGDTLGFSPDLDRGESHLFLLFD